MGLETIGSLKEKFRAAALSLRREGIPVSATALARELHIARKTVRGLLAYTAPAWKAELSIVDGRTDNWNRTIVHGLYAFAAKLLLQVDRLPTAKNLAEMLHLTPQGIRAFMQHHPDLAKNINFVTENECKVFNAATRLRASGKPVKCYAVAEFTELSPQTIRRIINKRPHLAPELVIARRTDRPFVPKKNIGPPIPTWLTAPKCSYLKGFPPFVQLPDRIITTVAQRNGFDYEALTVYKRGSRVPGIQPVRALAMYLLLKDTDLTASQVGKLFSNRRPAQVMEAQELIRKRMNSGPVSRESYEFFETDIFNDS